MKYSKKVKKCHWFDPNVTRRAEDIGQLEIRHDSIYSGDDVYIVAQQATQADDIGRLRGVIFTWTCGLCYELVVYVTNLWFMLDVMLDLSYLCGFVISVDFDMFHV